MPERSSINSDNYWDQRFSEDWETCAGPLQSRFFSRIAIENLPPWLIKQIGRQSLTLADWGCAQGDGTDVWASHMDSKQLVGVDFSAVAIEQATSRYPAIRFVTEDWLGDGAGKGESESYDVVFSSNTLEHFHRPYEVLEALCARANKAVVLALPYREIDRIKEHFFSFLPENVPVDLPGSFRLAWSRVIDCGKLSDSYWPGEQIILVYASSPWLESLKLTLSDCEVRQTDTASEIQALNLELAERDERISVLNQELAERDKQMSVFNQACAEHDRQISMRLQDVAERDKHITLLKQYVSERDEQIHAFNRGRVEHERQISILNQDVAERDKHIALLKQHVSERDEQIHAFNRGRVEHERQISVLVKELAERDEQIASIKTSASWWLTTPLRLFSFKRFISSDE